MLAEMILSQQSEGKVCRNLSGIQVKTNYRCFDMRIDEENDGGLVMMVVQTKNYSS